MTACTGRLPTDASAEQELSPLWRGCRISVIIPTYNRKEKLLECLRAMARQSILPQEFEVVVIDDGSTDGTQNIAETEAWTFVLRYYRQEHEGPATARNLGISKAAGELVLFIGDDIVGDERLLENHLLAHAHFPAETIAILGHITWPNSITPSPVMKYAYGPSGRQFGYSLLEQTVPDYRFFYTSNISLKRTFLQSTARAGVRYDPSFRYAALEDVDFGYRLEARGLEIQYWKDALAYHDHWLDLESFSRREYHVGQMIVVLYRKHPKLSQWLPVSRINDWLDAVSAVAAQPDVLKMIQSLENDLNQFLRSMTGSLERLLESGMRLDDQLLPPELAHENLVSLLYGVYDAIFTVERTRGEVQEWYANVEDSRKKEVAKSLISCFKGIEFINTNLRRLQETKAELAEKDKLAASLQAQLQEKDQLVQILTAQILEKDRVLQDFLGSKAGRLAMLLRGLRRRIVSTISR